MTLDALWTVINHWLEIYCCMFHILRQLKRQPNIFSWHVGQSCKDLRGNDDGRKEWAKRTCGCRGMRSEGHVIDIYNPTSRCRCQYVHLRGRALLIDASVRGRAVGAWRRPSISSLHKSLCLLLSIQHSLSLWPSICPASLVLLFYSHPNLTKGTWGWWKNTRMF